MKTRQSARKGVGPSFEDLRGNSSRLPGHQLSDGEESEDEYEDDYEGDSEESEEEEEEL